MFERFLTFGDGPTDAVMVDNADWLDALDYIPFLREVGQHFTVNRMLTFDSVKLRLDREQPLTFLEFNYMILQAYDFLRAVARAPAAGCRWADRTSGAISSTASSWRGGWTAPRCSALTTPLITTADGGKMGKTAAGAVWLNADQLQPLRLLAILAQHARRATSASSCACSPICRSTRSPGWRRSKARRSTTPRRRSPTRRRRCCTAAQAAVAAAETARRTFEEGAGGEDLPTLKVSGEIGLVDALIGLGLVASKNEARRLIAQGGARVDGEAVTEDGPVSVSGDVRISAGKKKHGLLTP